MLEKFVNSIKSLLGSYAKMRLLPSQTDFSPGTDVFSISNLVVVAFLFVFARGIVAGASTNRFVVTVLAAIVFFIAGFFIRSIAKDQDNVSLTERISSWIILYWIICLVICDVTDVPLVNAGYDPIGYYIFGLLPDSVGIQIPSWLIEFLRAVLLSVVGWLLLLVKTKRQVPSFPIRSAFTWPEFPLFVGVNSLLLFLVVFSPY